MIFLVSSHVGFIKKHESFGLVSHLIFFLSKRGASYVYVKHSLSGRESSQLETSNNKYLYRISKYHKSNLLIRSAENIFVNIKEGFKLRHEPDIVYIGVDPVNSLSGLALKYISPKHLKANIYLCADFADKRFHNPILNSIYHLVDKIALWGADEIWCVSTRIIQKRVAQGVSKRKIKLLPNSPFYDDAPRRKYSGNKNLIVVAHFNKSFDIHRLMQLIDTLAHKNLRVSLNIIGFGPDEGRLKRIVSKSEYKKNVKFLGYLPHNKVLNEIAKSFLGIALYTGKNSWNWYGDSMKAREYLASGIPLIINNIPSTADQITKYSAGLVIDENTEVSTIAEFVLKCASNIKFYERLKRNALRLGKDYDKGDILQNLFKKYL